MENIIIDLQEPGVNNIDDVLTGPQGPKGEKGDPGVNGKTPHISVWTVTTLNAGSPARVENVGSDENVILNFSIPRGNTGEQGAPGVNGTNGSDGVSPTITIGSTYTLSPDTPATVENVGTDTDIILNFGIPKGDNGSVVGCLSLPTIVEELPEVGDPNTFYFVPKSYTTQTAYGDDIDITVTDHVKIDTLSIQGYLDNLTPLNNNLTVTVNSDTYTIPLGDNYLAKVNTTYDEIVNTGTDWNLIRRIGYIESYAGETINTDYVSTSGTLTVGDEVYYVLEDEETIPINDDNIIDPLNTIITSTYSTGSLEIDTSADVTANLDISYHELDIDNQYDKYVYIIATSNYEAVGGDDNIFIPDGSITTAKLDDESVTTAKLADESVETNKLADNSVTLAKTDISTFQPVNYASSITPTIGTYNNNLQQVLLYPNGDVLINVTINTSNALTADTAYEVLVLPEALRPVAGKNITFMGSSYRNGIVYAYYQGGTYKIIARPSTNVASGGEISILSQYNINS